MFTEGVKCWRIDSIGHDPSLFVSVRLSGSPIARDLHVNVIFSASARYCHVFDVFSKTILHNKKAINRIARQRTKKRTATAYTSFLTGCSPRRTVENFSKGTCGRNDRCIIILTKETTKLSALLATSTHHVCIRRSLSHEPTCVGHKLKASEKGAR